MIKLIRSWWQDHLLRGVVKNSSYLFSSNTVAMALSMLQGIFAARLLGSEDFGILVATIIPFVSNINRLLSFRMSEVVVKYMGQFLAEGKREQAAAIVKGAALTDTGTSILAYLILLLIAPVAALYLAKDIATTPLFAIYGLVLLANFTAETATGVLQFSNLFNRLALIYLIQSIITASLIFLVYLLDGGMIEVLLAYLIGKTFAGLATSILAYRQLNLAFGRKWWRVHLSVIPDWRALGKFSISTNLQGTVNLVVRDSETLFISAFRNPTEAGYFRIAMGVINLVMLPIQPFIAPVYTEITRGIAQGKELLSKRLLKRITAISGAWTIAAGGFLVIFGSWLIPFLYGEEFSPAYPAMVILLIGYGFANILHWNRPLLLALGMPTYPLKVSGGIGLVKTILTLTLLPVYGYLAEAAILSWYFVTSISINVWRGIRELNRRIDSNQAQTETTNPQ
jgi:O-antigen/teichoic acid export membrane protein